MRKQFIVLLLIILIIVSPAAALEITTAFDIGNIGFDENPMTGTDYASGSYPWGLTMRATQNLGTGLGVDFSYEGDRVLNNLVSGIFSYNGDFFSIGAGPAFGVFNTAATPLQPGISTSFKIEWPGKLFLNFDLFSSIGYQLRSEGDYSQGKNNLTFGFYVPNAICSLNMTTKDYTEITASNGERNDSLTEYSFKTQIYQKNIPYRVLVGLIYRKTSTAFTNQVFSGATVADLSLDTVAFTETLNSLLLQTRVDMFFNTAVSAYIDLYSSIFSFGSIDDEDAATIEALSIPDTLPGAFLFEASLGVKINFDHLGKKSEIK